MDICTEIGPVEQGIPIPPKRQLTPMGIKLRGLRPGDSFPIKSAEERDNAKSTARYAGIAITVRKVEGGWRLWRKS